MKWIPVEDRLPENNTVVIGFCRNGYQGDVYEYAPQDLPNTFIGEYLNGSFWCSHCEYYSVRPNIVTHWMPLPERPKPNSYE